MKESDEEEEKEREIEKGGVRRERKKDEGKMCASGGQTGRLDLLSVRWPGPHLHVGKTGKKFGNRDEKHRSNFHPSPPLFLFFFLFFFLGESFACARNNFTDF